MRKSKTAIRIIEVWLFAVISFSVLALGFQNCADIKISSLTAESIAANWSKYRSGNWDIIDDGGGLPVAIGIDSHDRIYVASDVANTFNVGEWIVKLSTDSGNTWNRVDRFSYNGVVNDTNNIPKKIFFDGQDNIYVLGSAGPTFGPFHEIIRKSTDQGQTWTIIDDYIHGTNSMSALGAAINDVGDIIYSAQYTDSSNIVHDVLRRVPATGSASVLSDVPSQTGTLTLTQAIGAPSGVKFWRLTNTNSSSSNTGLVEESIDSGSSWSIFNTSTGINWTGFLKNKLYGNYIFGRAGSTIVVNKAAGLTLSDSRDSFTCNSQNYLSFGVTPQEFLITGNNCVTGNQSIWTTRLAQQWGGSWSTFDTFSLGGSNATLTELAVDSQGRIFEIGTAQDTQSLYHAIVRRFTPGK